MKILILEGLHGNNKGRKCQWRLKRTNLKVGDRVVLNCYDWKIIKIIEEKRKPKRFLSVDYGIEGGDYTDWIQGYVNKDGEIVIDRRGYKKVKEVKKVRPYFEMEVVKVKKKKDELIGSGVRIGEKLYRPYKTTKNRIYLEELQKGNWVNGENLDEIKFPCFCTHKDVSNGYSGYGMLISGIDGSYDKEYELIDIGKQRNELTSVSSNKSLQELIEAWDVHIIKGKIIIYEEE